MRLQDRVAVVTGGASGIGRALAERFAAEKARGVVVADLDGDAAKSVAGSIGGLGLAVDVTDERQIRELVAETEERFGDIDLFCSNAGIFVGGGVETPDREWQRIWATNVMAHVYAARAVLPRMIERGEGYLLATASAAGLLSQVGSASYSVTKHAAVALAEWLALSHADDGIKVSVLCPQAVRTEMTRGHEDGVASLDGMLEPETVADVVIEGLEAERFLILPHPEVLGYLQRKGSDYDRWLRGMTRLHRQFADGGERS